MAKCAKAIQPETNFCVLEVQQLATHLVNPRTKSWKIVVPYKYKQLMEMDQMYPPGWSHRKYFGARQAKDNPAKHPRKDDTLVDEVMQEQEQLRAEEKRLMEEKRLSDEAARLEAERKAREEQVSENEISGGNPTVAEKMDDNVETSSPAASPSRD